MNDAPRFRRLRAELMAATWLSYAGFYFCRKVFAVVKSPLKERFGLDDLEVSHLWTLYLITYMLGQFLAAWAGRRLQSRRILAIGMGIAAACNVLMGLLVDSGFASAYTWMFAVMALHGFAQATGWPHNVGLVAKWTRRPERGTYFAIWGTCYQIGSIGGKSLAAFLFGWLGMAWSFFGSSLVLFAIWAIFLVWAHETPESCGLPSLEEEPTAAPVHSTAAPPPGNASSPSPGIMRVVISMGFIYFGFKFVRYAMESWSALILREHFALATTTSGYLSAAFDWVGFLGVIAGGWSSDKLAGSRRAPVIFWMTAGCLAATVLMWAFGLRSPVAFVVLLGLIGLMAMGPDSLLSGTSAMDVGTREQAALAAGVINGVGSIGPIVQEPAIGWLMTHSGLDSVFLLLVAVVALATVGTGILWWSVRRFGLRI